MEKEKVVIYSDRNAPPLFKNSFLNKLAKTHPLVIDVMYAVLVSIFFYLYVNKFGQNFEKGILLFLIGFFSWTLGEYLLHRFLYHDKTGAGYNKGIRYILHGIHHKYPHDGSKVVLPPVPSLIIASLIFGFFYLIMGVHTLVFGSGFLVGYLAYMNVHYIVHAIPPPKKFNFWWRHHNIHHYVQHDRAFGVSTSLWDRVFGTMPEPGRVNVEIVDQSKMKKEENK